LTVSMPRSPALLRKKEPEDRRSHHGGHGEEVEPQMDADSHGFLGLRRHVRFRHVAASSNLRSPKRLEFFATLLTIIETALLFLIRCCRSAKFLHATARTKSVLPGNICRGIVAGDLLPENVAGDATKLFGKKYHPLNSPLYEYRHAFLSSIVLWHYYRHYCAQLD